MMLEQARHQISRGVLMEIRRQIGDADPIVRMNFAAPERRKSRPAFDKMRCILQLIGGSRWRGQEVERVGRQMALSRRSNQVRCVSVDAVPIANELFCVKPIAFEIVQIRIEDEGVIECFVCVGVIREMQKRCAAIFVSRGMVRIELIARSQLTSASSYRLRPSSAEPRLL